MMCVPELVQQQASASPEAAAIVAGEQKLTYRELEVRSNQLAHLLRAHGVGPEVPVGLCMTRSAEFVIAALAILKAGGAYVPIDPGYPQNRVAMILEDSGASLALAQACLREQIPAGRWQTIVVSEAILKGQPDSTPEIEVHPDHLAYIIFTSGSTGRPKGVQITHANLLNLIDWHRRAFSVAPADRASLHASPGFDAAVWEVWPYLVSGASLYVVDETVRTAAEALRDWLVANGITISFLPTALAELLIDLPWPSNTALRFLLTGADTLRRYPRSGLPFSLVNNYGPTECTVVATSGVVPAGESTQELPSIGKPIDSVQIYILDEQLRPVRQGDVGELVIAGAGVGRGYINFAAATNEKFLPDRFTEQPGARLYRTGDLARILPDGQIAFLGRMDEQIKVRGLRIEPQEISTVLNRHPAISASFVSEHRNGSNESHLLAYVVVAQAAAATPKQLRAFLAEYLPDYMIPSAFVRLESLPFTERGKIDRAALPQPTDTNILTDELLETPQSPVEERVSEIVAALLGIARISRQDNFFNLGGHSLMGAQIIAKVRDAFGVELSLRTLFDRPTVAAISLEIENLIHAKLAAMSEEEVERLLAASGM